MSDPFVGAVAAELATTPEGQQALHSGEEMPQEAATGAQARRARIRSIAWIVGPSIILTTIAIVAFAIHYYW
ncbi:MAG TPA: hypothetical protein VN495_01900 [Candidatus Paceibacterota bacterium]|nr:hypothetical protein [Candidatus Paceibacterota bacterium]